MIVSIFIETLREVWDIVYNQSTRSMTFFQNGLFWALHGLMERHSGLVLGGGARTHWFAFALKNPFRTLDRLRKKKEEKKKEKWMQGMSSFRNSNKQGAARVISWFGWRKSVIGCLDHSQAQKQRLFSPIVRSSPIVRNSGQKNGTQNNLWVLSDTEAFTLRSHKIAPDGNYTGFYTGSLTPIFIRANLCTYNHNKVHFSSQHYKTLEKYKGGEYFCKAPYIFIHL